MNEALRKITERSRRLVFFSGAGVSTASGIPDFRGADGLSGETWEGLSPEQILSRSFFYLHPDAFYRFYRARMLYPQARPNACHRWVLALERQDRLRGCVTQNIDGLHRMAGSIRLYELHGSVHRNYCLDCGAEYDLAWLLRTEGVPRCPECGGAVKPDVTLYGEPLNPYVLRGARREIAQCDTLIVAGTSLSVEPAASLLEGFRGRELVVINRDPTPADASASLVLRGSVSEIIGEEW